MPGYPVGPESKTFNEDGMPQSQYRGVPDGREKINIDTLGGQQDAYRNEKIELAPIMDEYGTLTKELDLLGETFDRLRMQLDQVTGPERPTADEGAKEAGQLQMSPMAESIRSDIRKVRNLRIAMRNLSERIEL